MGLSSSSARIGRSADHNSWCSQFTCDTPPQPEWSCNPRAATHHAAEGETCSSYLSNRPNGRRSQPQVKGHSSEPQSITPKGKEGTRSHQRRQQTQSRPKESRVRVHTASTRRNRRCNCTPLKVKEPTHGRKSMLPHGLIRKEGLGSLIANRLSN